MEIRKTIYTTEIISTDEMGKPCEKITRVTEDTTSMLERSPGGISLDDLTFRKLAFRGRIWPSISILLALLSHGEQRVLQSPFQESEPEVGSDHHCCLGNLT